MKLMVWALTCAKLISRNHNRRFYHAIAAVTHRTSSTRLSSSHTSCSSSSSSSTIVQDAVYHELAEIAMALRDHDARYYESPDSILISDEEYDALAAREAALCQANPEVLEEYRKFSGLGRQATRFDGRVGSRADSRTALMAQTGTPRRHAAPLLSLDNVHNTTQVLQWLERVRKKVTNNVATTNHITILSEPKLDGLSVALSYENGQLKWAATRGDGTTGTDVTGAMQSIQNLPKRLADLDIAEVRGEVILPPSLITGNFTNARNAAVGILLRKHKNEDDDTSQLRKKLKFYAYDTVPPVDDMRTKLQNWGFAVPEPSICTTLAVASQGEQYTEAQIQPLLAFTDRILGMRITNEENKDKMTNNSVDGCFDTDGCVHKVTSIALRDLLGNSNRSPRWAVAHKFPPIAAVTTLQDIIVQVGRTGVLTPVAVLSPVVILGVTIQRATLHNFEHLQEILKSNTTIPKHCTVLVRRAGDVIPQVVSLVHHPTITTENETISVALPQTCPACGSATIVDKDAKAIRCGGVPWDCSPRAVAALQHAFSRDALDIKGLSGAKLAQLRSEGYLQQPSDLFELVQDKGRLDQMKELAGWGNRSVDKLAETVQQTAKQGVSLSRFLFSLGIPTLGIHAARLLAEAYGNWETMVKDMDEASNLVEEEVAFAHLKEDTDQTKGIGPILLYHLYMFSRNRKLLEAAKALASSIAIIDIPSDQRKKSPVVEGPFKEMTVVFAGSISTTMSRKDAEQLAREMGAIATPSKVTKATGLVVAGTRGGKKRKEAESLGVRVMDGNEFLRIVEQEKNSKNKISSTIDPPISTNTLFNTMSVVFSGSLANDISRQKAQEMARQLGATSTPSQVTKSTGLLVVGSNAAVSKVTKAEALGIKIMDATAFMRIVEENSRSTQALLDGKDEADTVAVRAGSNG